MSLEARSKAYFIAAQIIERCAELDGLFSEAIRNVGIDSSEGAAIQSEMSDVVDYLRSQGAYYRSLVPVRVKPKSGYRKGATQ